jgi:NDP-hexose-3-ketoreductase
VKLLVVGLSNLVRRRVLPALQDLPGLDGIDLATRRNAGTGDHPDWVQGEIFADYTAALERSSAEAVYVSLVNSEHETWARAALESGRHVVVDKPAFLGLGPTEAALDLASRRNRCLAEATVWACHPQLDLMKSAFHACDSEPTRITFTFSVPPLDPENFRYCRSLGGGSVWDQGPYAVSVGRAFFGEEPQTVDCQVLSFGGPDRVDTAFSALVTYAGGRSVIGHFGFDTAYRNRLEVLGPSLVVEVDRAATTPPEVENDVRIVDDAGARVEKAPAANTFRLFFATFFAAIQAGDWQRLGDDLLMDARTLQRLRDAAGLV